MKKLLAEVSGVIEAPVDQVWPEVLADLGRAWAAHPSPKRENGDHAVAFQGGWWYRGEWSATPHPRGTLVVHRVYNVAEHLRWGVPLANRFFVGLEGKTREGFKAGIVRIGAKLGCSARLA